MSNHVNFVIIHMKKVNLFLKISLGKTTFTYWAFSGLECFNWIIFMNTGHHFRYMLPVFVGVKLGDPIVVLAIRFLSIYLYLNMTWMEKCCKSQQTSFVYCNWKKRDFINKVQSYACIPWSSYKYRNRILFKSAGHLIKFSSFM